MFVCLIQFEKNIDDIWFIGIINSKLKSYKITNHVNKAENKTTDYIKLNLDT